MQAPVRALGPDDLSAHVKNPNGQNIFTCRPRCIQLPNKRQRSILCAINTSDDRSNNNAAAAHNLNGPLRTALATAIVSSALLSSSFPAQAGEWHARRHHRRIKDEVLESAPKVAIPPRAKTPSDQTISSSKDVTSNSVNGFMSQAKRAYRKAKRTIEGDAVYRVGVSGRGDASTYYGTSPQYPQESSPLGWIAAALAVGGIAYAVWGGKLQTLFSSKRRQEGGRWIRDRSLGGKMVFIPDGSSSPSTPRPLWEDDEDEFSSGLAEAAATAASALAATTGSTATNTTGAASGASLPKDTTPEWWAPPAPASYVSTQRKEELKRQAKAALKELEDSKILRGEDYSVSNMVALRRLCHQGGGIQVRASTESGRDAILRAAVRAGIDASLRSSNPATALGGYEPARFVSGLAEDLNVPEKRAITIVHAEVAATCRSSLIDAEAAYRAGNQTDLMNALRKMVLTLSAFPLPRGSAEAELVGRSLLKQATLEFRRAVFLGAGSADLATAPVVAEMLGFDPELVMPQLLTQVAAMTQSMNQSSPSQSGINDVADTIEG